MPLVEQKLLTIPEHLSSLPVFSGVRVTRSLVLYVCFVDRCLSFCTFSFGHCVVCPSTKYGFWLPLWYLQTLLMHQPFSFWWIGCYFYRLSLQNKMYYASIYPFFVYKPFVNFEEKIMHIDSDKLINFYPNIKAQVPPIRKWLVHCSKFINICDN